MDIDRISYIFGSFARRRQSHEVMSTPKRRSIQATKIFHEKSKSAPHVKKISTPTPRAKSVVGEVTLDDEKFKCPMCKRQFVEPRVLPCLHTFCLKCLESLERNDFATWYDNDSDVPRTNSTSSRKASSGGSGYVSDKHDDTPTKGLCCPTCGARAEVPLSVGVKGFPPNYPLQHRMVLATLNSHSTHLLCDLCPSDVSASSRCMNCAISFCNSCKEVHLRQKSIDHEILTLEEARDKGITKIRKQILCLQHPDNELTIFCSTCFQVICKECASISHRTHVCETISQVARSYLTNLRLAMDRAKSLVEKSAVEATRLNASSRRVEVECNKVQSEVERFIDDYIKSIEDHKMSLLEQIKQVREEQMQNITHEKLRLQKKIKDARDIAYFLDDLLNEGTEVEVLSFVKPVMTKIEECDNLQTLSDIKYSDSLQFLTDECVKCPNDVFTLYGVLTTQSVSAEHCSINTEELQNLRVGKKVEVILETKDNKGTALERGGEYVTAEIRYKGAGVSRSLMVNVHDRRDGTYRISFVPDVAGNLVLILKVKGESITGSPFALTVRSLKPHKGTFHCCSFCSSGGNKDATCGCDGKMPGGYKGCGHGHEGHPGRRHWSCCGNILEHSECASARCRSRSGSQYQFTL